MHKNINDVELLPDYIPAACADCAAERLPNRFNARVWLVSPEGRAISKACRDHADQALRYLHPLGWTTRNIHGGF